MKNKVNYIYHIFIEGYRSFVLHVTITSEGLQNLTLTRHA